MKCHQGFNGYLVLYIGVCALDSREAGDGHACVCVCRVVVSFLYLVGTKAEEGQETRIGNRCGFMKPLPHDTRRFPLPSFPLASFPSFRPHIILRPDPMDLDLDLDLDLALTSARACSAGTLSQCKSNNPSGFDVRTRLDMLWILEKLGKMGKWDEKDASPLRTLVPPLSTEFASFCLTIWRTRTSRNMVRQARIHSHEPTTTTRPRPEAS